MIEVLVAVTLMGIVMTALTTFFVNSLALMGQQRTRQVGVQLASDAVETVRALRGASIDDGRAAGVTVYPAPGVAAYLTDMQQWNVPSGTETPTLPIGPEAKDINRLRYNKYWYVGRCWQPESGGDCGLARTAGDVEFFRVVVAVTWPDSRCPANLCSFITSTLVSSAPRDPVFNSNDASTPPTLNDPGDQTHDVTVVVGLPLTYSGGGGTMTWGASGLPPGLSIGGNGVISGTLSQAGTYSVRATVTDGFGLVASTEFRWTVNALPELTRPPDQLTAVGNPVSLPIGLTGGTPTLTWSVTGTWSSSGLPPGLTFNPATRTITGTPTTAGSAKDVTIRVTDRFGKTSSVTFSWFVSSLSLSNPGTQSGSLNSNDTVHLSVSGGSNPKTWTATGLPPGLDINPSSGGISGRLESPTRYVVTVVVTDSAGVSDSVSFVWTVNTSSSLRVTSNTGDRTNSAGSYVWFTATASGGSTPRTWTATGLPPGVTISSGGVVSGRPSPAGVYICTLTVRDSQDRTADYMFTWTVT